MVESDPNWTSIILPALIGAVSGSFGGNFVSDRLEKRREKDTLKKNLTFKYLIQLMDSIKSLSSRLDNMKSEEGVKYMTDIKGNKEYYIVSTLYALGLMLAYHRILSLEGIYAQIEYVYPELGNLLINEFEEFGTMLDNLEIRNPDNDKKITFFRYDRIALGDAITEKDNNTSKPGSYLKFKTMYKQDEILHAALEPAYQFVECLPFAPKSELGKLKTKLNHIQRDLEKRIKVTERKK